MGKRKRGSRDDIDRRLERLERMLYKRCRRDVSTCDEQSSSDNRTRRRSPHARSRTGSVTRHRRRRSRSRSLSSLPTDSSDVVVEETEGRHTEGPVPPEAIAVTEEAAAPSLPADLEGLLGSEGTPKVSNAIELHESIRQRWMAILQNGLTEEVTSTLVRKYDPPKNCDLLKPPKLNEEVAAAMQESGVKRDKRIAEQQTVLAAAISAIGRILNSMISSNQSSGEIEIISDAARLLCGLYHSSTITRRNLILPGLNRDIKETMTQSPISEYLFGDKLQDIVSACKALKKSAEDLKNTPAQKPAVKKTLNYRGLQRSQLPRPSGPKQKLRQQSRSTKPATSRSRRSPQRPRHPRRQDVRRH
ncbi:uncharacterized protein LOC123872199 [Maniola jurtina]|uniref:uncharacterized protein LOC123872199 n=1 Tax=Maniola jurtina TaxID=191418 RepID=UPI001E686E82|nr:uncharacterized protein LOC123872199 [Maniola jurtina]XP_045772337.1 uncharacterized protein LOC123872199 [Maniola jurtina]